MTGGAGISRSFDFEVELKDGQSHHFSSLMKYVKHCYCCVILYSQYCVASGFNPPPPSNPCDTCTCLTSLQPYECPPVFNNVHFAPSRILNPVHVHFNINLGQCAILIFRRFRLIRPFLFSPQGGLHTSI